MIGPRFLVSCPYAVPGGWEVYVLDRTEVHACVTHRFAARPEACRFARATAAAYDRQNREFSLREDVAVYLRLTRGAIAMARSSGATMRRAMLPLIQADRANLHDARRALYAFLRGAS